MQFKFGAEVYTWFMKENGKAYENQLGHMIDVAAKAGFVGIEPIYSWMGDLSDPNRLADKLNSAQIQLAAIALVLSWNGTKETKEEQIVANQTIGLLQKFPGSVLCTVQMPEGRHDLKQRRHNLVANLNSVSRRAADSGIPASFHPNSPATSINRTKEDYRVILEGLDESVTGWTPDVGHIINGGMDPLATMQEYANLINHVHYKDWDGQPEFSLMGEGKVDFTTITRWLMDQDYEGWIICEDEAEQAIDDPDGVTLHDGRWIQETLLPSLKTD